MMPLLYYILIEIRVCCSSSSSIHFSAYKRRRLTLFSVFSFGLLSGYVDILFIVSASEFSELYVTDTRLMSILSASLPVSGVRSFHEDSNFKRRLIRSGFMRITGNL